MKFFVQKEKLEILESYHNKMNQVYKANKLCTFSIRYVFFGIDQILYGLQEVVSLMWNVEINIVRSSDLLFSRLRIDHVNNNDKM